MAEENAFTWVWVETPTFHGYTKLLTSQVEQALQSNMQHTSPPEQPHAHPASPPLPPPDEPPPTDSPPEANWSPALLARRHERTGWNADHKWNEYYTDPAREALDPSTLQGYEASITSSDTPPPPLISFSSTPTPTIVPDNPQAEWPFCFP